MLLTETSETPKVWSFWTCPGLILRDDRAKIIKKYPNISICMSPRIVHFYFFRFWLIYRQFRHFVFRIGSYETDRSAICLRIAAKTRTKPTGPPSTVYRTNMDSCVIKVLAIHHNYADIFEKETTKLLSWRIYISIDFMVTTTLLSRTTGRPKRHLKKWRLVISSRN